MEIVVIDTRQIQTYIFGSNRLRENIGASYLVKMATEDWIEEVLLTQYTKEEIEQPLVQCPAQIVYTGGGNAVLYFREDGEGKEYIKAYSRAVLQCAPGLQITAVTQPFSDLNNIDKAVDEAHDKLEKIKQKQTPSLPLMGMGVTVSCRSTGLAAREMYQIPDAEEWEAYPISAEILAKLKKPVQKNANGSLDKQFNQHQDKYEFPYDLDNLGRSAGEQSYVAVVHIDGNDMGQRIKAFKENLHGADAYLEGSEQVSNKVDEVGRIALEQTVATLINSIQWIEGKPIIQHRNCADELIAKIALKEVTWLNKKTGKREKTGKYYLPFRPIVFGGDDITFVCDGRLGISLALTYIKAFEAATEDFLGSGDNLTACAGVAVVKSHYPFARAYGLAEALCQQAKMYRRHLMIDNGLEDISCVDWHFALSGLLGTLAEIRQREYCVEQGHLTLRPLTLGENKEDALRAWPVVETGIHAFQDILDGQQEANWSSKRNKVKALRDALRQGPLAVDHFRAAYRLQTLPAVTNIGGDVPLTGWSNQQCVYFDALELADWYIPLTAPEKEAA